MINFHKSTFAPIHVDRDLASDLASFFGCSVASFPQSYLGLPLSTHKLNIKDFFFIIDKIDRRLAGWRGVLLTIADRAILVRAVLRALPINLVWKPIDHFAPAIWKNYASNKCRIFLWLACKNRLFTNERRFNRGLLDSNSCLFCTVPEPTGHLFLHCSHLRPLWLELTSLSASPPTDLRHLRGPHLANKVWLHGHHCCPPEYLEKKKRKGLQGDLQPIHLIARSAADGIMLWSNMCSSEQAMTILWDWCIMLFHLSERL